MWPSLGYLPFLDSFSVYKMEAAASGQSAQVVLMRAQSCLTLCHPMDCSPPGSCIHGILHARTLEWVAFPSLGDLPDPGIKLVSLASPDWQAGSSGQSIVDNFICFVISFSTALLCALLKNESCDLCRLKFENPTLQPWIWAGNTSSRMAAWAQQEKKKVELETSLYLVGPMVCTSGMRMWQKP